MSVYSLRLGLRFLGIVMFCVGVSPSSHSSPLMVNGAGATFPYPIYSKWFSVYEKISPQVVFNYQPTGSGGGLRQLFDETIEFAGSDYFADAKLLAKSKKKYLHFPTVIGAVVLVYSLPGYTEPLKLTPKVLADIYLGKITQWDDKAILKDNPHLQEALTKNKLKDILVVRRAEGSGTTGLFSEYLSRVSEDWNVKVGRGTALHWPVGIGGKGNEGVTFFVHQVPGSLGYVELAFAKTLNLKTAWLQNPKGKFIEPNIKSLTEAALDVGKRVTPELKTDLLLSEENNAYPLSAVTYLVVPQEASPYSKPIQQFLLWMLNEGQKYIEPLHYAPLPEVLLKKVKEQLNQMRTQEPYEPKNS